MEDSYRRANADFVAAVDRFAKTLGKARDVESNLNPLATPEQLLKQVIQSMCDEPQDVRFDLHVSDHSVAVDVHLAPSDVSKVIGGGGSHAFALRTIFSAIYGRLGKKLHLMIVDPRRRR